MNPNEIAHRARDLQESFDCILSVGVSFSQHTDISVIVHARSVPRKLRQLANDDGVHVGRETTDGDLIRLKLRQSDFTSEHKK